MYFEHISAPQTPPRSFLPPIPPILMFSLFLSKVRKPNKIKQQQKRTLPQIPQMKTNKEKTNNKKNDE